MDETEWPKPNLKSSIGKAPRVPKFGTWQKKEDGEAVLSSSFDDEPLQNAASPAMKTPPAQSGRLRKLGSKLLPSSAQSSSEDISSLLSLRSGSLPHTRQRFTKDFEQARLRKKSGADSDSEAVSDSEACHGDRVQSQRLEDGFQSDRDAPSKATIRQGTDLFRCPSEPLAHWSPPSLKKAIPPPALDSALKHFGTTLRQAGRTGSAGAGVRNQAAKPPRYKAPGTPSRTVEAGFPEPTRRKKGANDTEKDKNTSRATPVFGEWAEDSTDTRALSPMSSYSSIFEEARVVRKKQTGKEALERLKAAHATTKEEEFSCPDFLEITNSTHGLDGTKAEMLAKSSLSSIAMSEVAWLRLRMASKASVDNHSSASAKYADSPTKAFQIAAKSSKGGSKLTHRSNSEVAVPSRFRTEGGMDSSSTSSDDSADKDILRCSPSSTVKDSTAGISVGGQDVSAELKTMKEKPGGETPSKVMSRNSSLASQSNRKPWGLGPSLVHTTSRGNGDLPSRPRTAPAKTTGKGLGQKPKKNRRNIINQVSPAQSSCGRRKAASHSSQGSLGSLGVATQCSGGIRLSISSTFRAWFNRRQHE